MNKIQYIAVLVLSWASLLGQNPHVLPYYDFIDYSKAELKLNSPGSLEHTYNKIDEIATTGKGKLKILQLGGSHIQADIWTNDMRERFQSLSPDFSGDRGFIFPFKAAKTNNPSNYKVINEGKWQGFRSSVSYHNSEYGLSGITCKTKDENASITIQLVGLNKKSNLFNKITVFHKNTNEYYGLDIDIPYKTKHYDNIIGATVFELEDYSSEFKFTLKRDNTEEIKFELYGFYLENDFSGIELNAIGVNGAATKHYLGCDYFEQHLSVIKPDLVIFSIGINDAFNSDFTAEKYKTNYEEIVRKFRNVSPDVEFIFITNNDSFNHQKDPNVRAEAVRNVMLDLNKEFDSAFWDLYGMMGGLGSIRIWENKKLAKRDYIHFTGKGYRVVGSLMVDEFFRAYTSYIKNKKDNT